MSKKTINDLLKNSTNIETKKIFDNGKKWEANIKGEYKTMAIDNGFSKKQIEQLSQLLKPIVDDVKEIKTRLDKVETRLDKVETRLDRVEGNIKDIKSCPTIKKEIK